MLEYLLVTFIVIICIQYIYYILFTYTFIQSRKTLEKKSNNIPVSVIICAKNEAENLRNHLPKFLDQKYLNFEIVLVNDCSYDDSLKLMQEFQKKYPSKIKIVDVKQNEQFWGSKKYAITLGIKAANFEHLLFSDADCMPISENWISEMTNTFSQYHQIILGYGSYEKVKNSFINKLIRFETLLTAMQYFSYAKIGIPYMGVGRNLAYTKTQFFNAKGFAKHIKILSGDDDLFINQVANNKNTAYCITKDSFTQSKAKTTLNSWVYQKRRHILTVNHYKFYHKILLSIFYLSNVFFWVLSVILLLLNFKIEIVIALIFIRFIVVFAANAFAAKKLKEQDLLLFLPFYEIFLILIHLFIFIKNLSSKPSHW